MLNLNEEPPAAIVAAVTNAVNKAAKNPVVVPIVAKALAAKPKEDTDIVERTIDILNDAIKAV